MTAELEHRRLPHHVDAELGIVAACSCGDYATNLPSKRAGDRWQARHFAAVGRPHDLSTPRGRGIVAGLAHRYALAALAARHADELVHLENLAREELGLRSLPSNLIRPREATR